MNHRFAALLPVMTDSKRRSATFDANARNHCHLREPIKYARITRRQFHIVQQHDPTTRLDLFGGIPVTDYSAALEWYERLLGPPSFFPRETEAVWELAAHQYLYIVHQTEHAGHAMHTLFVNDLDALIAQIAGRGLEFAKRETYLERRAQDYIPRRRWKLDRIRGSSAAMD